MTTPPLSSSPSDTGWFSEERISEIEHQVRCWPTTFRLSSDETLALCALARRAQEGETRPVFPEESYEHPLVERLRAATHEFSHPRLGIQSTGKHIMPITTEEASELLWLLLDDRSSVEVFP